MRPKKPATDVQPERSAMLIQHNKVKKSTIKKKEENIDLWLPKPARLCRDKNCQSTRCYKNMSPRRPIQSK